MSRRSAVRTRAVSGIGAHARPTSRRAALSALVALSFAVTAASAGAQAAEAEPPRLEMTVTPWAAYDGTERPYRHIVSVRSLGGPAEVVADRRLLSLEVRPSDSRRRYRCSFPAAPRTVSDARVRTLSPGDAWTEWVDLRMYCTGRALSALEGGAEVRFRYGWPRASRRRWVGRAPGEGSVRRWVARLELEPLTFPALASSRETRRADGDPPAASPISIEIAPTSARTGAGLIFRPSVAAREGTARVYVRPDAWSFTVRGPTGAARCRIPSGGGPPPPDLFRRITPRVRARESLVAAVFCPEDTFARAGVYEVTPKLRLEHSGEEFDLDAVTGRFVGSPSAIRITRGDEGYVEQVPTAEAAGE